MASTALAVAAHMAVCRTAGAHVISVSAEDLTDGEGEDDQEREGREHDHERRAFLLAEDGQPEVTREARASPIMPMPMAMLSARGR